MMKIQKKIRMGCNVLHRFSISKYDFTVKKIVELQNQLLPSEKEEFEVFPDEVDVEEYLRNCIKGCRYYILKDKPETIPAAIRHIKLYVDIIFCLNSERFSIVLHSTDFGCWISPRKLCGFV